MLLSLGRYTAPRSGGGGLPAPALALDFTSGSLDPAVTFTRASSGTYFDDSGILQTASTNTARFDHKSDGTALGLLIEEARTNNLLYARDFSMSNWAKTNLTTALTQTGIDGASNSASLLSATASNGRAIQALSLSSAAYTYSLYIKRITGSGVIEITNDGLSYTDITAEINSSTFTRIDLTATQSNPILGIRIGTSGDEIAVDYAQFETGSFPTSAILTTTAAATRSADVVTLANMDWYNASSGTLLATFSFPSDGRGTAGIFNISDNSFSHRIGLLGQSGNQPRGVVVNGATQFISSATPSAGPQAAGEVMSLAMAYVADDFTVALEGGIENTDTSGTIPTVDQATIGNVHNATAPWNGHIAAIRYYGSRLSDNTLETLTA